MKQRIAYFDFLRGLAIMMVVGIHTYSQDGDSVEIRQLLNAAVPIFIAISGYFLSQKKIETTADYYAFLRKQLPKVYLPVLVWSLPLYLLGLFAGTNILLQTALCLCCGLSIYYFVAFIMQCYIVLPIVNTVIANSKYRRGGVIASCIVSFTWIVGVVYVTAIKDINVPLILYAGPLPCWIMYFVLGVLIGHDSRRKYSILLPVAILIMGFGLSVLEANYLLDHYGKGVGIKPSAFIYSAGMIFLLFSNRMETLLSRTGVFYRFIVRIGGLSFGIYLIHCYFINFAVKRLPIDGWLIKWALVLLLTALFIETTRKIFPMKCHKYLGI